MYQFSGLQRAACVLWTLAVVLILCVSTAWASGFGSGITDNSNFSSGTLQLEGTTGANSCYSTGTGSGGSVSANSSACSTGQPVASGTLSSTASSSATTTLTSVGKNNATSGALASTSCGVAQLADSASATDWGGTGPNTALVYNGVTYGASGPLGTASTAFDGSTGWAETTTEYTNPETLTVLAWFKTSSPQGVVVGFDGDNNPVTGSPTNVDRLLFIDASGDLVWGVEDGGAFDQIASPSAVDTGSWLLAAATLGPAGSALYVNGTLVASHAAWTSAKSYSGWWALGYQAVSTSWSLRPTNFYFNGSLAQVAVVPSQLTGAQVSALYGDTTLSGYSAAVTALSPANYWQMNDSGAVPYEGTIPGGTASTALQDASGNGNTSAALGGVTLGASGPTSLGAGGITLNGTTGYGETTTEYASPGPETFSFSSWFKTTTATGSIFGYNNSQTTGGSMYDRMLWMDPAGHLVVGLYPNGTYELASPSTYDDGAWHFIVVTVAPTSSTTATVLMYLDGTLVAGSINDETISSSEPAQPYAGWWHLGWSNAISGWSDTPTSVFWEGSLSEMVIFPSALTSLQASTLYKASSVAAFDQDVAVLTPTSYWPLQDSASNICGMTELTAQTTVGSTNICIYPAAAGPCPAPNATYLEPGLGERSITAPTAATPVVVLVKMELTAAPPAALAGLHELMDLNFGTEMSSTLWSAQTAYPAAWSQL